MIGIARLHLKQRRKKLKSIKNNQTNSKQQNRKNRKRTGSMCSSRGIRSGYIDLEVSHK